MILSSYLRVFFIYPVLLEHVKKRTKLSVSLSLIVFLLIQPLYAQRPAGRIITQYPYPILAGETYEIQVSLLDPNNDSLQGEKITIIYQFSSPLRVFRLNQISRVTDLNGKIVFRIKAPDSSVTNCH